MLLTQPLTGFQKALVQKVHHEVYRASVDITHVTLIRILAHVEVEAGVTVVVEGTEGHVTHGTEAKPLSNSLYGECSELQKIGISNSCLFQLKANTIIC